MDNLNTTKNSLNEKVDSKNDVVELGAIGRCTEIDENKKLYNTNNEESNNITQDEGRVKFCNRCCNSLRVLCRPCIRKENPLPHNPTKLQKLKHGLLCPPLGKFAKFLTYFILLIIIWSILWSITGKEGLPGGNFFSIYVLCICCIIGGYGAGLIKLPPLLGILPKLNM